MKHAREDYNRIQDPDGLIPEDEPVFLIRGQDLVGALAVERWADLAHDAGASEDIVQRAREQALRMRAWRMHKVPDIDQPKAEEPE